MPTNSPDPFTGRSQGTSDGPPVVERQAAGLRDDSDEVPGGSPRVREGDVPGRSEAIRESERRFRDLANTMPQIVWTAGPDGSVDYFNSRWYEYTGMTPEASLGEGWRAAVHPGDIGRFSAERDRALGGGGIFEAEVRLRDRGGGHRWHLVRSAPVKDGAGRVTRRSGTATDIDDRRRAEVALRESERRFAGFMQHLPGLAWIKDAEGRYIFANDAAERAFGRPRSDLYGRTDEEVFPAETAAQFRENDRRALEAGAGVQVVETLEHEGGDIHHSLVSKFSIPGPDGEPGLVGGMAIDITDRMRAEEALLASEEHYRAVYDQAAVGIAEVDLTGRFTRANDRYCEIVGYPREELLGLRFQDITHPDDPAANLGLFDRISERKTPYTVEKRYVRKDGRVVWARAAVSLIRDGAGLPAGVVAVAEDVTERVQALGRLRESEANASLALGVARLGTWAWGLATGEVTADARCREVCGLDPDAALTMEDVARRVHPDDWAGVEAALQAAIRPGGRGVYDEEFRFAHPDGSLRWVVSHGLVALDGEGATGRPARLFGTVLDITDRKEAEMRIRESEGRFRQMADAMPQIVWMSRPDQSVAYFNGRWFRYTGQSEAQAYGPGGWGEAIHPEDLGRIVEAAARTLATGEPFEAEYRIRRSDGVYRWHLGRGVDVHDSEGRVLCRFGTATEIDDRRRAEDAARFLAGASAKLASLVDEASTLREVARLAVPSFADWCVVDMVGEAGTPTRLAVAHVDPSKEAYGHEIGRRYPPGPETPRGIYRVLRTGESEMVAEITDEMLVAGARDEEHLGILRELGFNSFLCVPLRGRAGTMGAISFVASESGRRYGPEDRRLAEDLASRAAVAIENARLYDALREADRRKDEFLATLAHELRNPLAPIRTALHLMRRPDGDGPMESERAMAERQVIHLARLIDDLMDVARISKGKIELHKEVVDLSTVVDQAVETARPLIDERRHRLTVAPPGRAIRLEADPTRLEQVLWNLLNNAAKYSPPGGRIDLIVEPAGGEVVIRVRDSGIGIEPEMLPRIFEMFVQVRDHGQHAQGGLGIGLSLVRTLVEMHGGSIAAHSEGPGAGSEFVVRLPILEKAREMAGPRPDPGRGPVARPPRRRILVVDDNVDAARSLARLLTRLHDQEVRVAHDGHEALTVAEEFHPEVVLLDIGLPGMDGHEVARRLREQPEFAETLIVALTGWGQESDVERSRAAGFDHHLVKPANPDAILELLAGAGEIGKSTLNRDT